MRQAANRNGLHILHLDHESSQGWEKADGVLLCDRSSEETLRHVPAELPCVSLLVGIDGMSSVYADDYSGAKALAEYLLQNGHERIAYLHEVHKTCMCTLSGKVALITGASGGIGSALVQAFLDAGVRVVASDVVEGNVPQTEYCNFVQADISIKDEVSRQVSCPGDAFGELDILVNNAAVLTPIAAVHNTTVDEFERVIAVNLRAAFLLCKLSYPYLKSSRGCVLNISSMAGLHGEKEHAIYAASKGALNALTQSMAIDWGAEGIRVNALCPSSVLTPNVDKLIEAAPNAAQIIELRRAINVLGFTATSRHIADVAVFLCSPQAAFITGSLIPFSGGSECGYGIKY